MEQEPLFTPISEAEYEAATRPSPSARRKGSKLVTEPRTLTTWIAIETHFGFCTVPAHDEIQRILSPEQQIYRDMYPTRLVFEIEPGIMICRDCFIHEGDKESDISIESA
jgi:hypothetical protein